MPDPATTAAIQAQIAAAQAANAAYRQANQTGIPVPVGMDPATYLALHSEAGQEASEAAKYAAAYSQPRTVEATLAATASPAFLALQSAYAQQHYNTIGGLTPVANPQYTITPESPPMNTAAAIAARLATTGGIINPIVGGIAISEGYTGPVNIAKPPIGINPVSTPPEGMTFVDYVSGKQTAYEMELRNYNAAGANNPTIYSDLVSKRNELGNLITIESGMIAAKNALAINDLSLRNPVSSVPAPYVSQLKSPADTALWGIPATLFGWAAISQKGISDISDKGYNLVESMKLPPLSAYGFNALISAGITTAAVVPTLLSVPYALTWSALNPTQVPGKAAEIGGSMIDQIVKSDIQHPGSFAGTIIGTYLGGKVIAEPLRLAGQVFNWNVYNIPIKTPEGLPATELGEAGFSTVVTKITEDGKVTIPEGAGEPPVALPERQWPISYAATYKGLSIDTEPVMRLLGHQVGSEYSGKVPVFGYGTEPTVPGEGVLGTSTKFLGAWFGRSAPAEFGGSITAQAFGTVNLLQTETAMGLALQKLDTLEALKVASENLDYTRAIMTVREITDKFPNLLQPVRSYGEVSPISFKNPETLGKLMEYANANAKEMRFYGSMVGNVYGTGNIMGDWDNLIKSDTFTMHAQNLYEIYLNSEYGPNAWELHTSAMEAKTINEEGKPITVSSSTTTAIDRITGGRLAEMSTARSAITGTRIIVEGELPGVHVLDLHPANAAHGLEVYNANIPGTVVKSIPPGQWVYGIGTIPEGAGIGTLVLGESTSDVMIETSGRVKDAIRAWQISNQAAVNAITRTDIPTSFAERLELAAKTMEKNVMAVSPTEHIAGYPKGFTVQDMLAGYENPLENPAVDIMKQTRGFASTTKFFSGIPVDLATGEDYVRKLSEYVPDTVPLALSYQISQGATSTGRYSPLIDTSYGKIAPYEPSPPGYNLVDIPYNAPYYLTDYTNIPYRPAPSLPAPNYNPLTYAPEPKYSPGQYAPSVYNPSPLYDLGTYNPATYTPEPTYTPLTYNPSPYNQIPPYTPPSYVPPYTPPYTPPPYVPPPYIPPYNPPTYTPGGGGGGGTELIPPPVITPPPLIPPSEIPVYWERSKRKKHPARFLELFSFEMGTTSPVPTRFGLGGVNTRALGRQPARFMELFSLEEGTTSAIPTRFGKGGVNARAQRGNPEARFIPGYRGYARKILAPEDIAPQGLFDIVGKGQRKGRKRTVWENMIS